MITKASRDSCSDRFVCGSCPDWRVGARFIVIVFSRRVRVCVVQIRILFVETMRRQHVLLGIFFARSEDALMLTRTQRVSVLACLIFTSMCVTALLLGHRSDMVQTRIFAALVSAACMMPCRVLLPRLFRVVNAPPKTTKLKTLTIADIIAQARAMRAMTATTAPNVVDPHGSGGVVHRGSTLATSGVGGETAVPAVGHGHAAVGGGGGDPYAMTTRQRVMQMIARGSFSDTWRDASTATTSTKDGSRAPSGVAAGSGKAPVPRAAPAAAPVRVIQGHDADMADEGGSPMQPKQSFRYMTDTSSGGGRPATGGSAVSRGSSVASGEHGGTTLARGCGTTLTRGGGVGDRARSSQSSTRTSDSSSGATDAIALATNFKSRARLSVSLAGGSPSVGGHSSQFAVDDVGSSNSQDNNLTRRHPHSQSRVWAPSSTCGSTAEGTTPVGHRPSDSDSRSSTRQSFASAASKDTQSRAAAAPTPSSTPVCDDDRRVSQVLPPAVVACSRSGALKRGTVFLTDAEKIVLLSCLDASASDRSLLTGEDRRAPAGARRMSGVTIGRVRGSKFVVTASLLAFHMTVRERQGTYACALAT